MFIKKNIYLTFMFIYLLLYYDDIYSQCNQNIYYNCKKTYNYPKSIPTNF